MSEASLNGFSSSDIAGTIQTDPYRFLICADKFQTGYDEPLLHTMYVDKPLSGIKAVQTLSRLNRAHPQKHDCFVLDFQNNNEAITFAFQNYYRTTLLAEETDPNKLHDLKAALDDAQVYSPQHVHQVVELFLGGADRDRLDPILDACVVVYVDRLTEDGQVEFKGKAKAFCRTYGFLASIIPYTNADWERLSIFLDLLTPKLAGTERGRPRQRHPRSDRHGQLPRREEGGDEDCAGGQGRRDRVRSSGCRGHKPEPELDRLSNILKTFNEHFGTLFTDTDRVANGSAMTSRPKSRPTRHTRTRKRTRHTPRASNTTRHWPR